ncbi:MAG: sensor histidine kinase [Saprospiraceae bacterium]
MNKKAIWAIIGLMSVALIGVVLLQAYWINWSLKLKEDQFKDNVFRAINRVANKFQQIEYSAAVAVLETEAEGFTLKETRQKVIESESVMGTRVSTETTLVTTDIGVEPPIVGTDADTCSCEECQYNRRVRALEAIELMKVNRLMNSALIEERIHPQKLDFLLGQELSNAGIRLKPHYGVYSNRKKNFVIVNGHFVVEDNLTQVAESGYKNLFNSSYRVSLFPQDPQVPGLLMVYFPNKASIILASVWKTLLGSIVFSGIILFCFAYTVQVIFRQKKVSEMKTDFINNMTHEFKTPIATISLAADSITSPMISGSVDKVNRFADIIKQENTRMLSQVEKVLRMAQIDRQDFELKIADVDLHQVISRAVEYANLQVTQKGGIVTKNLKASKSVVKGDLTHLSNIINNLLDNANKYSPEQPEISVTTRNVSKGVEVIIKDNGIGMSKEALKHIFDKFYRVHTGNRHDVKGFGLGLSYVKGLVTAHKGEVSVKSELGKGSSFIVFLPFEQT